MSGAMNVNAIAWAIGTRASPKKNSRPMTVTTAPLST